MTLEIKLAMKLAAPHSRVYLRLEGRCYSDVSVIF